MKRVNISITEKYKTLQKIEEGKSTKKSVEEEYIVKKNIIFTWIANKRKIFPVYESGQVNSSRKKLKKRDYKDLDEDVFTWFKYARSDNIPINGIIVKEKALRLAKNLELTDFRALPGKSLHYQGDRCSGGKHSNVRLTGLATGNATREKLALFVVGKSAKPRCFSVPKSLPCYRFQKKSWIYGDLFTEWVKELDQKFAAQDRKIALFVDNRPIHLIVDGLKAIELIFLSPNTTQPMDQDVISSLKVFYRHSIIKRYITSIDQGRSPTKVNILEVITLLTAAWECVSQ